MKRRIFLQKSMIGALSLAFIHKEILASSNTGLKTTISPYSFNLDDPDFQRLLKSNSLPKTLRIKSIRKTPDHSDWQTGEGLHQQYDKQFNTSVRRHNNRVIDYYKMEGVFTPVTLLKTAKHDVYGQFFYNQGHNFNYGIIKGFDQKFHIVHPIFRRVFTYKYNCYGLPSDDFQEITCRACGEKYIKQYFQKSCDATKIALFGWQKCSRGGRHSGIPSLENLEPCGIKDDQLDIGAEF